MTSPITSATSAPDGLYRSEEQHQKFLKDIQASELSEKDKATVNDFMRLMFSGKAKKLSSEISAVTVDRYNYSSWQRNRLFETIASHNTSLMLPFVAAWMRESDNNEYLGVVLEEETYRCAIRVVDKPYAGDGIRQFVANRAEKITSKELGNFVKILSHAKDRDAYATWLLDVMGNLRSSEVSLQRSDSAAKEFEEIVKNWDYRLSKIFKEDERKWQSCHTAVMTAWLTLNKDVLRHGLSKRSTKLKINAFSWVQGFADLYEYCPATEWLKVLKAARVDFWHWTKESLSMRKNSDLLGQLIMTDFSLKDFASIEKDALKNPSVFYSMSTQNHTSNLFARDLFRNANGLLKVGATPLQDDDVAQPEISAMKRILGLAVALPEGRLYAFLRVYGALNEEFHDVNTMRPYRVNKMVGNVVSCMEFSLSEKATGLDLLSVTLPDGAIQKLSEGEMERNLVRVKDFYLRECADVSVNIKTGVRVKI